MNNRQILSIPGQKSVDLWEGNEGWEILSGDEGKTENMDYYKFIPTLYRAIQIRMYSVGSMPFVIMRGKTEFDNTDDWQNKLGWMPNPKVVMQLVEASLCMSGAAYLFKEKNVLTIKKLRYHLASSVTPHIDPVKGLQYFERPVNSVPKRFEVDDYVYFWPPDPYVEIGEAKNFPAQAAANAGGVLLNVDLFASAFFKRGAIKAMLLTVQGNPKKDVKDKLQDWWRNVVSGIQNAWGSQVINADAVQPVVIGEGLKELENVTLGEEKREDVAIALGIPMSILFANAANYATSKQDELHFLNKTVIPDCEFIASVWNEQVFEPLGLRMKFLPESLDAMQEDEEQRAAAMSSFMDAIVKADSLEMAQAMFMIYGMEVSDEAMALIEEYFKKKEEKAEEMRDQFQQQQQQPGAGELGQVEQDDDNTEEREDMRRWKRKSLNALKKGNSPAVSFISDHISEFEAQRVSRALKDASTAEDIENAFAVPNLPAGDKLDELVAQLITVNRFLRERDD